MKKIMLAVASVAITVVLTGCSRSPSSVAEKFANAVIQRDTEVAVSYYFTAAMTPQEIKSLRDDQIEKLGKAIDDNKLEASTYMERILVANENSGHKIINGKKVTEDTADVTIQFVKGKDKKSDGMKVDLVKVDGAWRVLKFKPTSGLDTTGK